MIRRLVVNLEAYQIYRLVDPIKSNIERRNLIQGDANIARQQIPGTSRDQAEGNPGIGKPGTDHPNRAVTAGTQYEVDVLAYRLFGHGSTWVVARGLQPKGPIPPVALQLILHVPPKCDPVGDLGRVEDHRGAP